MSKTKPSLSVATYNVLADCYVRPEYYPLCDAASFLPQNRHPLLLERVAKLGTDLICLQEVEYEMFARIHTRLVEEGYVGRWAHKGRGKKDGCATFIRDSVEVRGCAIIEYEDAGAGGIRSGHVAMLVAVAKRGLEMAVVNTHLKFDDPDATAEQAYGLRQSKALLDLVSRSKLPTVLCGDFNAEPSGVVIGAFMGAGYTDPHDQSVHTCAFNGRPHKIDYLLHSPQLVGIPLPAPRIDRSTPLPSATEPSDHLPLRARFARAK